MKSQSIHKQIMREYDAVKSDARQELEMRKIKVYSEISGVEEIDKELLLSGIRLSKAAFESNAADIVSDIRTKIAKLKAEKENILKKNGIPCDFLKLRYNCETCEDTGYIGDNKCRCYKQRLIDKYYEASSLKGVLQRENFDTFDINLYSDKKNERIGVSPRINMQKIYTACSQFTKNFMQKGTNIILSGDSGLGKTFMCNCIAKDVMDDGHYVLYVTAPAMFKAIEAYRFSDDKTEEMAERINMLMDVDLLIIDDLGSEFYTVITGTELFHIVNSRMLARKSTVISTNLSEVDLQRIYSDRIFSRFVGNYEMFYFFGDDIRIKKRLME
ncbi:MAG: ATP-binding protein [Defluviitaleaceae bacterium]|nr:ATP-binding protein [Defluviitaleaceae bacterium]